MKRYVLVFRNQYVMKIDGCAIFSSRDCGEGVLMFETPEEATMYALQQGITERYLRELEYQEITITEKKGCKKCQKQR